MVGPLAHMLKNRFYLGEVAYRGEIHKGEHAPILERELFEAVQAKLAGRAVQRKVRRSRSPSLLMGLIFDDRGNPMSPSHANKKGVRYRYYVSQAILQNQKSEVGSVCRVSGPDIEAIVVEAVRHAIADGNVSANHHDGDRRAAEGEGDQSITAATAPAVAAASPANDRDLITRHVARIVLRRCAIEITMSDAQNEPGDALRASDVALALADTRRLISVPWSPPVTQRRKGIVHQPASDDRDPRDRDTLLTAIAKSRSWMDDLIDGKVQSFEEIADREQKVVRHIQFLAPLAFLSPRIVAAIANGDVPAGVTVSGLVRSLPLNWADQEQRFGLR